MEQGRGNREKLIAEANTWFYGQSDFDWWCEAADFDPAYVREKAQSIVENGYPFAGGSKRRFSEGELDLIREEKSKGRNWDEIARMVGRDAKCLATRYWQMKKSSEAL